MYKNKKVGIIGIIITIILLTIIVVLTNIDISTFSKTEGFFGNLVMPLQNGLTKLKNKISGNNSFFRDINELKEENKKLEEENNRLKEDLKSLEIIKAENATLRAYNNMKTQYTEYETVPAYIINRDISNLSDTMVINVGTDNGVEKDMPVITSEGLVGYTISVTNKTAKVKPIIDASSSTSSLISTSRESVVAHGILGSSTTLKLMYIPTDADLVLGDTIETSGMGGIYPKGIIIGKISEIIESKNITERSAIVETAVDFSKLETVLVITQ